MPNPLGDRLSGALQSDLVWHNQISGANAIWHLDGTEFAFNRSVPQAGQDFITLQSVADPAWEVMGTGDFNGDQETDLVWRNQRTGDNIVWYLSGSQFAINPNDPQLGQDFDFLPKLADTHWEMQAVGDFNHDGSADLVWRHQDTGANVVWYLNKNQFRQNPAAPKLGVDYEFFAPIRDRHWQIKGAADFNSDGFDDLIWRNAATGENVVWFLQQTQFAHHPGVPQLGQDFVYLNSVIDRNWDIAATGYFNDDQQVDLVWRNQSTGQNIVWFLNETTLLVDPIAPKLGQDFAYLPELRDASWTIVGSRHRTAGTPPIVPIPEQPPVASDPPIPEPDGATLQSAFVLGAVNGLKVIQASISSTAANDYYRFSVNTQQSVNVFLNNLAANADLELLDAGGVVVKDAFQRVGTFNADLSPEVRSRILNPGTYYLRVYGNNINTPYQLSILGLAPTTNYSDRVVELTDFYRTQSGLSALQSNTALTNAAQGHSQAMALNDFFDHQGLNGSTPTQRAQDAGYVGVAGENIAAGQINAEQVMERWMYSAGHRSNILNATYQDIGVGYYYLANDPGTQPWKYYWTSLFGIRT
jgi:uncharacterized protein YkwD